MKKKLPPSGQEAADYVVGQVSGSLGAGPRGALDSLFGAAAPAAPLQFRPAPEPVQTSPEEKQPPPGAPEVKGQLKRKTPTKAKSAGERQLENRESGLQGADEDERGQRTSATKKKREEPGGQGDAERWVMKRQRQKAGKAEEDAKRKRTVFVGNLPVSCTKKTLRSLFGDKGSIESIRFRSVVREDPAMSRKVAAIKRQIHPKKQNMNAYVVFKDEEGVAQALQRNGAEIEKDFHIRVDRVALGSSVLEHNHKRSVFVGNLSFEMNDLALRRHFEECGAVEAVRLVRDQDSGLGKGFGYVLFESADSVQLALELDGSKLEGRGVRVKRSVKKEKQKGKSNGGGAAGKAGRGPGNGAARGSARETASGRRAFKSSKQSGGQQQRRGTGSASFRGEMVDPKRKEKKQKKGLKKKVKPSKKVHI